MPKALGELTESAMKNLQCLLDSNTIIGKPIESVDGVTIVPVSKVSFGFATGGGDLPSRQPEKFAGGSGAGVTITPVAFLIIQNGEVKIQQVQSAYGTADRLVGMVPDVVDKVTAFIDSRKKPEAKSEAKPEAKPE